MSDAEQKSPAVAETEENHLIAERKAKLERLRAKGNAFPNDFRRNAARTTCRRPTARTRPSGSTRTRSVSRSRAA